MTTIFMVVLPLPSGLRRPFTVRKCPFAGYNYSLSTSRTLEALLFGR
jgi:hypothetical protein